MNKILTIAKNTLTETLRQPIYGVIIVIALVMYLLSPSLSMYTMDDDNKLLREIGLSTLFLTSLFIAIFSAAGAVAEEMENKTIMTVLSKPIPRPFFILAKFLGVCGAVALAHFIGTVALIMIMRHGVLSTASDTHDWTVISAAGVSVIVSLLIGLFFSYAYDWKFSATALITLAIMGAISILFLSLVDPHWSLHFAENKINRFDIYASILLFFSAVAIAALALALSARFNIVVTLAACLGIVFLGLVSDWVFGKMVLEDSFISYVGQVGRSIVPHIQAYWVTDAIFEEKPITFGYIRVVALYTLCYTGGILSIAVALFQRRQVG